MSFELHVGDVGVPIQASVLGDDGGPDDYSGASALEFTFQKPDGTTLVVDGVSTVVDGEPAIRYYFADGDLDQPGTWKVQLRIEADDEVVFGPVAKFKVKPNLPLGV